MTLSASQQLTWLEELEGLAAEHPAPTAFADAVNQRWRERFADAELALDVVIEARPAPDLRWALNCGYAFGGLNSALLLEAP